MKNGPFLIAATTVAALTLLVGWGIGRWSTAPPAPASPPAPSSVNRGAMLFQVHCAACHGSEGHGDGASAAELRPPPRDFASRPWRFEPTRESIRRVTAHGVPNSAMPAFALPPADLDAIVAHVELLAKPAVTRPDDAVLREAGFTSLRGAAVPPLTLVDSHDKTLDVSKLRGQLVLLHFWGTSCVHCIQEIPALDELEKAHAGKLKVVHVCASDEVDAATAQGHLDRLGAKAYVEPHGLGLARFEVQLLPTVWLIGADGKAIARASGAKDWKSPAMTRLIDEHLPKGD